MKFNFLLLIVSAAFIAFFTPLAWLLGLGNTTLPGVYSYHYLSQLGIAAYYPVWLFSVAGTFILTLLFYRLVKLHTTVPVFVISAALFFVLAPVTLFLSMSVSPYLLALLLLFLGLNMLESRYALSSLLPFFGLLFFDWLTFLSTLAIVGCYLLYTHRKLLSVVPFIALFLFLNLVVSYPLVMEHTHSSSISVDFFSIFGSIHGLGIFTVLLSILGIAASWPAKEKLLFVYFCIGILLVLFFIAGEAALYFLYPIIVLFAALAYTTLWQRSWALPLIRTLTLATLAYGVLFSGLAYVNQQVHSGPTKNVLASAAWLSSHPFYSDAIVLSHPQKGFWLEPDGIERAFIDYNEYYYAERLEVMHKIFASRDFKTTGTLLEENGISLIWIDDEMRNGQVWNEKDEGLLFLLSDERFLRVYESDDVEIWRFRPHNSPNP